MPIVTSISYPSGSLRKAEYEPEPWERRSPGSLTLVPPAPTPCSQEALTATIPSPEKLSSPKPGLRVVVVGDEEDRFGDSPADRPVLLEMAPPAKGREQRVVERGAPLEIGDLQEDVVQHRGREAIRATAGRSAGRRDGSAAARRPAEEADREQSPGDAPDRDHREVVPGDSRAAGRHVGVEERVEEMADREDVGEVDDAVRQLVFGDEDAGEEVERQQQRVDDRRGGLLRGDRRGQRDAEAAEGRRRRRPASGGSPAAGPRARLTP